MAGDLRLRPKLWMPEDLAEYLGVPLSWIYKRTRKRGPEMIPHIKLGKYLRFDPESPTFQNWFASHQTGSAEMSSAELNATSAESLTLSFPVNRVRATEKRGQVLTKGESVYGS